MDELAFERAEEEGWATVRGTRKRLAKAITTIAVTVV
jgi:hypothetical protein